MKGNTLKRALLAPLLCAVLLSGCMKPVKLNERAIIQGIGIDWADGRYALTLQIFDVKGGGSQTAVDASKNNSLIVSCEGETLSQALEQAALKQGRRIFYGQNKLVVVGEDAARRGVEEIAGFLSGNPESRPNVDVVMAAGEASGVITAELGQSVLPVLSIKTMLESGEAGGQVLRGQVFDIVSALENGHAGFVLPLVEAKKLEDDTQYIEILGSAVFSGDKFAGAVDPDLTRGLLWLRGEAKGAHLTVKDPALGAVSLEVVRSGRRVTPSIRDGTPHFEIACTVKSHIEEAALPEGARLEQYVPALERQQAHAVRTEIERVLTSCLQALGSDIFGFSSLLDQREHAWFAQNGSEYASVLPKISCQVTVDSEITRYGLRG